MAFSAVKCNLKSYTSMEVVTAVLCPRQAQQAVQDEVAKPEAENTVRVTGCRGAVCG